MVVDKEQEVQAEVQMEVKADPVDRMEVHVLQKQMRARQNNLIRMTWQIMKKKSTLT